MEPNTSNNKLMRILTIPIRALGKARDLYVRSMNGYAANGCHGGGATFGCAVAEPLPRSFSTNSVRSSSSSDDLRELIRAASSRVYADRIDLNTLNHHRRPQMPPLPPKRRSPANGSYPKGVARSASVGMAKIEEDKPCEFEDDERIRNGKPKDNEKGCSSRREKVNYAENPRSTTPIPVDRMSQRLRRAADNREISGGMRLRRLQRWLFVF